MLSISPQEQEGTGSGIWKSRWMEDLSILVLSTQQYCMRLKLAMIKASDQHYKSEVKIKLAENVKDIIKSDQPDTLVDYVVMVADSTLPSSLTMCLKNLARLEPNFIATRICLINGSAVSGPLSAAKDLISMADNYNIPYMNCEIMDNTSCKLIAERILKVAILCAGYKFGIPVVLPTPKDLGLI